MNDILVVDSALRRLKPLTRIERGLIRQNHLFFLRAEAVGESDHLEVGVSICGVEKVSLGKFPILILELFQVHDVHAKVFRAENEKILGGGFTNGENEISRRCPAGR